MVDVPNPKLAELDGLIAVIEAEKVNIQRAVMSLNYLVARIDTLAAEITRGFAVDVPAANE